MVLKKLKNSFHVASDGIAYTILTQRNMRIHVAISLFVLLIGMWLHFTYEDTIYILFSIAIVMGLELVNTAVETVVDLVMPDIHPLAKNAKDVAAGSVLLVTFIVIMIGIGIIFPYLYSFYLQRGVVTAPSSLSFFSFASTFLLITTYIFKAYWTSKSVNHPSQPQILIGILLFIDALIFTIYRSSSWVPVGLTIILLLIRFKKGYTFYGFIQNIFISISGFYLLYFLFF